MSVNLANLGEVETNDTPEGSSRSYDTAMSVAPAPLRAMLRRTSARHSIECSPSIALIAAMPGSTCAPNAITRWASGWSAATS
jgi:hypothetical protein